MNKKKLYITLGILSIVFLSIGGTLAYYTTSATATNITQIKAGNLTMTVDGGGNENVSFMPAKCTSEYAIKKKIVASATNTSGGKVSFSIGMNITSISDTLKRNTMKWALTTVENSCTDSLIANGSFKDTTVGNDIWLIKNDYADITLSSNKYTKIYYLYIWLDEKETQNLSGTLSVKMKGTTSNNPSLTTDALGTLYYEIKNHADTTTQIDFSQTSEESNTNGIYITTNTDSGNPVYYYRGNVDNNIIFANFCWKIIRTTETGGIKLIYNGVPSNGQCNNATGDATIIGISGFNSSSENGKYAGYMYGDSIDDTANTNDSTIKTKIDTWYKNNMTSYTSQLEDTVFCNDRSYRTDGSYLLFGANTRVAGNKKPSLACSRKIDKFTTNVINGNGDLTYPVGLITADEMAYAGAVYMSTSSSFYLYNGTGTWSMSMSTVNSGQAVRGFYLFHTSFLGNDAYSTSVMGVRPVLALKSGTVISGGSGTTTDPYIVE